jgi:adenosine deaminase
MNTSAENINQLKTLISDLPKVELHRHLPGSLRLHTILDLAEKYHFELPTLDAEELKKYVQVTPGMPADLAIILGRLDKIMGKCFINQDAIERIAFEMIEDAWKEGIVYLEVRFSPDYLGSNYQIPIDEVISSTARGLKRAEARYPVKTGILLGMSRHRGLESCIKTASVAISADPAWHVVGIDLSGEEARFPVKNFKPAFDMIREAGNLGITIHAGEAAGADNVRDAIEVLGAHRIGHGVRSVQDTRVLDLIKDRQVTLETCPTSNRLSGALNGLEGHPLKAFLKHGLLATINTDDPGWFAVTLNDEYETALVELGLTFHDLKTAAVNAARGTFTSTDERDKLANRIETAYEAVKPQFAALGSGIQGT